MLLKHKNAVIYGAGGAIGGAVADGPAWEWIFWLNVPIGLLAIPLVLSRIQESFGADIALDIRSLALMTGATLGVVWGLIHGNSADWGSLEVVAALAAGSLLAVAFVAWELRAREPMVPMRFFRSRAFSSNNAANSFLLASLFGAVFFLAQFLQTPQGYEPLDAGLRLVPWTATLMLVAPIAGALADRIGERPLMVSGLLLQAVRMGLDQADRRARPRIRQARRAADRLRLRRLDGNARRPEFRHEFRRSERDRQGVRHLQHVARARRGVRDRDPRRGVRWGWKLRLRSGVQ